MLLLLVPAKGENGQPRKVDDFQPPGNIQAHFAAGQVKNPASIRAFASKFNVDKNQVKRFLDRLKRTLTKEGKFVPKLSKGKGESGWAGLIITMNMIGL